MWTLRTGATGVRRRADADSSAPQPFELGHTRHRPALMDVKDSEDAGKFLRMPTFVIRLHRLTAWPEFLPRITSVRPVSKHRSLWVGDLSASWRPIRRHAVLRLSAFVCKRFRRAIARTCLPVLCNMWRSQRRRRAVLPSISRPRSRQLRSRHCGSVTCAASWRSCSWWIRNASAKLRFRAMRTSSWLTNKLK